MAEIPGGGTGLLVKDYKGKEADRLVTRIDPAVVAMAAELRFVRRFGVYNRPMFGVRLATGTGKQYSFFVRD
jgi:hypothetical protein